MTARSGPKVEERLQQTSLYRSDLDLVVLDSFGDPVAYCLFWFDPATHIGFVEPMRTEDNHQRRGLAKYLLTVGIQKLIGVGANRIKINYENDNPRSGSLYRKVGFVPTTTTRTYRRQP